MTDLKLILGPDGIYDLSVPALKTMKHWFMYEICDNLGDYTIIGTELAEVSPAGQFHMLDDSDSANISIHKTWGAIPDDYTFEVSCIFDQLVATKSFSGNTSTIQQFVVYNGVINFAVMFADDGIYVYDGASHIRLSGSSVYTEESWHTWKFIVTSSGGAASATVDIYRDGVLLYSDIDCSAANIPDDGKIQLNNYGKVSDPAEMHVDWYKIYTEAQKYADGDLISEDGLDTALLVSLFTDARASASQVPTPELRRGWMGNTASLVNGRELGGLLWLLDQTKLTQLTLNEAISYARDALAWFTEDGLATKIEVDGDIVPQSGISLAITITTKKGTTETRFFNLWELTGN